jgi:hypothetical protein
MDTNSNSNYIDRRRTLECIREDLRAVLLRLEGEAEGITTVNLTKLGTLAVHCRALTKQ